MLMDINGHTSLTEDYCSPGLAQALQAKAKELFEYYHLADDEKTGLYKTVTHQRVMKWLREVHHIIFVFKPSYFSGDECTYWTYERWCGDNFDGEVLSFKTYEEAVEAALKYCLENLI